MPGYGLFNPFGRRQNGHPGNAQARNQGQGQAQGYAATGPDRNGRNQAAPQGRSPWCEGYGGGGNGRAPFDYGPLGPVNQPGRLPPRGAAHNPYRGPTSPYDDLRLVGGALVSGGDRGAYGEQPSGRHAGGQQRVQQGGGAMSGGYGGYGGQGASNRSASGQQREPYSGGGQHGFDHRAYGPQQRHPQQGGRGPFGFGSFSCFGGPRR